MHYVLTLPPLPPPGLCLLAVVSVLMAAAVAAAGARYYCRAPLFLRVREALGLAMPLHESPSTQLLSDPTHILS